MEQKKMNRRSGVLVTIFCFFFLIIAGGLFVNQIIKGEAYATAGLAATSKSVVMEASRGEILDRSGAPLVVNRQGNAIIFESPYFPSAKEQGERNKVLSALIRLFEESDTPWIDNLPIVLENGVPKFAEDRENDIAELKSKDMLNLNSYATAQNCMDALIEKYELQDYSMAEARKIASVCYEMRRLNYSTANPYTFSQDVSTQLVAKIKENSAFFRGVNVKIVPYREYADGTLAPHIIGRTAAIDAEEYKEKKSDGYKMTDFIGKSGIEKALEEQLRGTAGTKIVTTDRDGNSQTVVTQDPKQGDTVVLTIDAKLQKLLQKTLGDTLNSIKKPVPSAGAAIVIDVNDFSVLACATYPYYDISTYAQHFQELNKDETGPLWDRALKSSYEPGSTIKISVALAALEEGIITASTTFSCTGHYTYLDQSFKCDQVRVHKSRYINVVSAIDDSCNSFFYECGRLLGYSKINEYRSMLGLGQATGIELAEGTGVMDSPEYRASVGSTWYAGYNIQTAIGQGNLFTPIQLAVYTGTVANGGTRYRAHFVDSVRDSVTGEAVIQNKAEVVCQTGFAKKNLDTVRSAMLRVGTTGYCKKAFAKLPVKVAAKTGTSQVVRKIRGSYQKINNGILITFAPYENPEIAVVVVGEGVAGAVPLAPIAATVYDYYFSNTENIAKPQTENSLLS